jgi:hypothetical protein
MRLREVVDLDEGSSIFSKDDRAPGYFVDGKQIAHFFAPDFVEVRLAKTRIRAERDLLKADSRVELRKNASDWLKVRLANSRDTISSLVSSKLQSMHIGRRREQRNDHHRAMAISRGAGDSINRELQPSGAGVRLACGKP